MAVLGLLKNISFYSYLRKTWKKDVFEMILTEPNFFQLDAQSILSWKVILDNLFTQDKSTFNELLSKFSLFLFKKFYKFKKIKFKNKKIKIKN